MNPQTIIKEIFESNSVTDANGNSYRLDSNIDESEGNFLADLIRRFKPKQTIEVGCAYGLSSLYISSVLAEIPGAHHTIIDPCQSEYFHNIGINHLQKANFNAFTFYEEVSEIVLPGLLKEGKKFDLSFIDGDHRLEHVLIDFFYLNRMTDVGGIIVLDDVGIPAINKVVRYILNFPAFKVIGHVPYKTSGKRELVEAVIKKPLNLVSKLIPSKMRYEIFAPGIIKSNKELGLNSSMIAFQKVDEDKRTWDWYKDF